VLEVAVARHDDIEPVVSLADERRRDYEVHQPVFWRQAENAVAVHRSHLHGLVDDGGHEFLVAREDRVLAGYIIGRLAPAPPVYKPGGLTCSVDDFAVRTNDRWATVGTVLLRALAAHAQARGAVQIVVVTGVHDDAKRQALQLLGLETASEWWVGSISRLAPVRM
jgi:ribosomal protein S18 acetylase RimI-like enzyme